MANNPDNIYRIPDSFLDKPQPVSVPGSSFVRQELVQEVVPIQRASPLQEALQIADTVQYTPENQPEAFRVLKDLEERIYSYHSSALALEAARKKGILEVAFGSRKPLTETDLIEMESRIFGRPFGKGHRLWLAPKDSGPLKHKDGVGDWFYTGPIDPYSVKVNPKNKEVVIHYETLSTGIKKLIDGVPYDVVLTELETLLKAATIGEAAILEELYPFEATIHDLQEEIEIDNTSAPNEIEQMIKKKISERVVNEYRESLRRDEQDSNDDYPLAA